MYTKNILAIAFIALVASLASADVTCNVFSAFDNSAVAGALCTLRSTSESILYGSNTTDATGTAVITYALSDGDYLLRVTSDRFYVSDVVFTVSGTVDHTEIFSVSPILNTTAVRAVLRWGLLPNDLDSHVYINAPGFDYNHVYYSTQEAVSGAAKISLDVDDTTSYGPETMTFEALPAGFYTYWVYSFSGEQFSDSNPVPTVELYTGSTGNGIFKKYTCPVDAGNTALWWHVFNVIVEDDPNAPGCTTVRIEDVNVLKDAESTTARTPVSGTSDLGQFCRGGSSVCNNRVTGTWKTCGNFGDPHIITWDREGVTCRAEGTTTLITNQWFTLAMTNVVVDATSGATATESITLTYKQCNPMTITVTPTSFPEPVNAPDAGVHIIRREGNNLYLDAINTRIQIRESGDYLVFGVSTPFWNNTGLCNGCPGDTLDTTNPGGITKRSANAFTVEQANTTCMAAGLNGFFLDACIFDLVTTGSDTYVAQASAAVSTYAEVQQPFQWAPIAAPPVFAQPPVAGASGLGMSLLVVFAAVVLAVVKFN